LLTSHDRG